jgi:hypothetical protein
VEGWNKPAVGAAPSRRLAILASIAFLVSGCTLNVNLNVSTDKPIAVNLVVDKPIAVKLDAGVAVTKLPPIQANANIAITKLPAIETESSIGFGKQTPKKEVP